MRPPGLGKSLLVVFTFAIAAYIIISYIGITNKTTVHKVKETDVAEPAKTGHEDAKPTEVVVKVEKIELPKLNAPAMCDMKKACDLEKELAFAVVSGSANVIGPSVCVNGKWLMSNSIGNCNRGMNVVIINGTNGVLKKTVVFDLFSTESKDFKEVLGKLDNDDIIFIATYDDATWKLRDDARDVLTELGSKNAKMLAFRDSWIFVSGKNLQKRGVAFEEYLHSDKAKNKFGNWPAAVVLEGCLPRY